MIRDGPVWSEISNVISRLILCYLEIILVHIPRRNQRRLSIVNHGARISDLKSVEIPHNSGISWQSTHSKHEPVTEETPISIY